MWSLTVGSVLVTTSYTVFFPFLPLMLREYGVQGPLEVWVGASTGGFFLLSFLLTPVWGALADHYGNKIMVLRTAFGMAALFLVISLAPNVWLFVGMVVLVGTVNGYVASALSLVVANTPLEYTGKAVSWVQMGGMVGNSTGPLLGAWVSGGFDVHRHQIWLAVLGTFLAGVISVVWVREKPHAPAEPFQFRLREDFKQLARIPGLGRLFVIQGVYGLVFFGSIPVVSVYTVQLFEHPQTSMPDAGSLNFLSGQIGNLFQRMTLADWIGWVAVAMTLSSAIFLPLWGRAIGRTLETAKLELEGTVGFRHLLSWSLGGAAVGAAWVALARNPLELALARAFFGIMAAGLAPMVVSQMRLAAPEGMTARALAFGNAFAMLGIGLGPLLAGIIGPWLGLRIYWGLNVLLMLGVWFLWRTEAKLPHQGTLDSQA